MMMMSTMTIVSEPRQSEDIIKASQQQQPHQQVLNLNSHCSTGVDKGESTVPMTPMDEKNCGGSSGGGSTYPGVVQMTPCQSSHDTRLGHFLRQLKCSGYKKLPETCGLSISELEAMAARQGSQLIGSNVLAERRVKTEILSTQDQLLAAKAQRLRFLKSGGEAERLQRLREKVATQEERLRKLRALRGKVQNSRGSNSALSSDLDSLRAVFNEKEKELSLAVAKVDDLTRQLDDLRRGGKEPSNGQSVAAVELEKLRRELLYRQKLREAQQTRVAAQRAALSQRQEEAMRVDRRIAELQERLHRKRLLNQQLAATLKQQESVEDFVSVPSKNDPKYQTLPYNAKLFAPFANKHDRDNFEKSLQQMQIMHLDAQQQQQQNQQSNNKSNHILKYPSNYSNNNIQLHQLLSQNQHNAKSANHLQQQQLQQQLSAPSLSHAVASQSSGSPVTSVPSSGTTTASGITNGPQTIHSIQASNVSRGGGGGKAIFGAVSSSSNTGSHTNENSFQYALPRPTGTPTSAITSASGSNLTNNNSAPSSNQLGSTKETSSAGSNASVSGISVSDGFTSNGHNSGSLNLISSGTTGSGRTTKPLLDESTEVRASSFWKPALPPKPTPPPRGQGVQDVFSFNQRLSSSEREGVGGMAVMSDRTELPIKPKPLFIKKSNQNTTVPSIGTNLSSGTSPSPAISATAGEKEQSSGNSNNNNSGSTTRSSNENQQQEWESDSYMMKFPQKRDFKLKCRRIEMPPAFLFPESDPPPSDLVPEHQSSQSSPSSALSSDSRGPQTVVGESLSQSQAHSEDSVDSTALHKHTPVSLPEEYTLPDLFPQPPNLNNNMKNSSMSNVGNDRININHSATGNLNMTSVLNSNNNNSTNHSSSASFQSQNMVSKSNDSIPTLNNNIKEYNRDSYFATNQNQYINMGSGSPTTMSNSVLKQQQTSSHLSSSNNTASVAMNNMNLIRSANINLSPSLMTDDNSDKTIISDHHQQQQQHFQQSMQPSDIENVNHVSVMSIQVSSEGPLGESKMDQDLSPIQLDSYEVLQEQVISDPNIDRDENASDNSGSTITTTTSSVSSGSGGVVVRRVKEVQKKGNLKSNNRDHAPLGRRVSFDPLALLLDASLEGELDLVVKTAGEVGNASAANDEGITALHNAICAGHAEVVRFLVEFGCDVNAQDSDGWTPLHCAASCNNVGMVKFLVERGACIFATTLSDHETAAEKCEEDEDGHLECEEYLTCIQEKLGIMNGGVVYAVFDYEAQNPDELGFQEGDHLMILRKGDEFEREWWWARLGEKQGYVPRNLLGLYPRVPQKINES